jgi:hypothetical protein
MIGHNSPSALNTKTAADWRDRRLRAADDFSTGVEQAILGVRTLIEAPRNTNIRERAIELVDEAVAPRRARQAPLWRGIATSPHRHGSTS